MSGGELKAQKGNKTKKKKKEVPNLSHSFKASNIWENKSWSWILQEVFGDIRAMHLMDISEYMWG